MPKESLGYERMNLTLESLLRERDALIAQRDLNQLSAADKKRLIQIESHIQSLNPVMAKSTELEQVNINLDLPYFSNIRTGLLGQTGKDSFESWHNKLWATEFTYEELEKSLAALSSRMSDDDFITHFPAYLQIATGSNERLRQLLYDFCSSTLLAKHKLHWNRQNSNIPFTLQYPY